MCLPGMPRLSALPRLVAGIDEAGRGCLAGPVVAAAVILPEIFTLPGLTDSKAMSVSARERLAPRIKASALAWGLGVVWPPRIDAINILQATFEAMSRATGCLRCTPGILLIDGNKTLPEAVLHPFWQAGHDAPLPTQQAIVEGDRLEPAISAASVLAKTFRDGLMQHLARRWPGYAFEKHKGYGTKAHYAALRRLGPCPQHRMTFKGVMPETVTPNEQQGRLC
ncbi:MAG: ribonuclease HII [Desulfovibrionaceae bacterium]|nr:ribonuclease HII [Desulfovibrionaceae bacterium]